MHVNIKRNIFSSLTDWRNRPEQKVLLLREPRQVRKTYIVRQLDQQFDYFLEINFGGMKSMRVFMQEKELDLGIRVAFEKPALVGNILVLPIYAISELDRLIKAL